MICSNKLSIFGVFILTLTACIQDNCVKNYAFEIPITVTPKDTFVVGDTIWWEMDIPNQLLDHSTGYYIDVTDVELYFSFFISEVDSTLPAGEPSKIDAFTPVENIGSIQQLSVPSQRVNFRPVSVTDKRFRHGMVALEAGTYHTSLYWSSDYITQEREEKEEFITQDPMCQEYMTIDSKVIVNNNQTNYHMIDGICKLRSDGTRSCYGTIGGRPAQNGSYAFHVKEP